MSEPNGKAEINLEDLTKRDILELILQKFTDLEEQVQTLVDGQGEVLEKLNDMDVKGEGFQIFGES